MGAARMTAFHVRAGPDAELIYLQWKLKQRRMFAS